MFNRIKKRGAIFDEMMLMAAKAFLLLLIFAGIVIGTNIAIDKMQELTDIFSGNP